VAAVLLARGAAHGVLFEHGLDAGCCVKRVMFALGAIVLLGGATAGAAWAQKTRPTTTGPDADGDGVADAVDRCPNTPRGTRVNRFGCRVVLLAPGAAAPAGADTAAPGQPRTDSAVLRGPGAKPARAAPSLVGRPGGAPATGQPAVTPQAAGAPAVPAAAPAAAGFTAGLAVGVFEGDSGALPEYLRRFGLQLDSAVVSLVNVFRNTSGQPLAGADAPTALSARERDRWTRCRDLHWDLQSYATAMHEVMGADLLPDNALLRRAAAALDSALTALEATAECDNVASMLAAPDRWSPWGAQYAATARRFYAEWYPQLRGVHEHNRGFLQALNAALPAARRVAVPAAIPRTPPYAGAAPR
jgi:hypothetical protein